ncbi:hypothetical protein BDZ90DRAFT_150716 [Jaminaea rosea]|uniref:Uncharacterized protein n=1 Tax=Jaminaea rosea TaxID=1569628 RepID=A0A316UT99_9BASI|nr:hypothetical protein BDZ90DRAFT_150716 [Jaminaea rosea]PWN28519.1 hypothetical protein BDZ90DRAFT_150716 [Jaminaea rosea]
MAPKKKQTETKGKASASALGTKRKSTEKAESSPPKKSQKGEKPKKEAATPASQLPHEQKLALLRYLLTPEALAIAYPPIEPGKGEVDRPRSQQGPKPAPKRPKSEAANDSKSKQESASAPSYPSNLHLTPFQTLLISSLLSKPISHRLGLRSIATLFSPPYSYTTPQRLADAGVEGRRAALWDARTQHKEKTAEQLGSIVEGVSEMCEDTEEDREALGVVRGEAERLAAEEKGDSVASRRAAKSGITASLVEDIKGVGPGAVGIFMRRIQNQWPSVFPYADERSLKYAAELGLMAMPELPGEHEKGEEADEEREGKLFKGADDLLALMQESRKGQKDQYNDERDAFVRLLDVLIGLGLEKKTDEARKHVEEAK